MMRACSCVGKTKAPRGVGYSYWSLCQTHRTARGPRQRVVASLGKLGEAEVAGWNDLSALLAGDPVPRPPVTPELPGLAPEGPPPPCWEQVDVRGVRVERTRDFGEAYLGLALWRRLKLDELLRTLLPAGRESVDWARMAALLTIARFCAQRSEPGIVEH
jgi:hypothetical protein